MAFRVKLLILLAEIMLAASGYAQPTDPLTIKSIGLIRSGYAFEVLTYATVYVGDSERVGWKRDPSQSKEWSASDDDYTGSGYDRFHLAPAGDFSNQADEARTFVFSNCAPGNHRLNIGPWKQLEESIRIAVTRHVTLYVFTAPLYLPDNEGFIHAKTIGPHGVPVPTHFGKAVLQMRGEKPSMVAWIMPNIDPPVDAMFENYKVTVNEVEFSAGEDLFSWIEDRLEEKLEAAK